MSTIPQFKAVDGSLWTVPGAQPVAQTTPPPVTSGAPVIPASAIIINLDNLNSWKGVKDKGTPGGASGISSTFVNATLGRHFVANQTGRGGVRWSTVYTHDSNSNYFVYDVKYQPIDPTQMAQLELDHTQVLGPDKVCFLCVQASANSKTWEYTTTPSGKCHWNKSNISVDPTKFPSNVQTRIRHFVHRDDAGVVYYDGVSVNGNYTAFDPSCKGLSVEALNWTKDDLLVNFQMNGANASGTMEAYASITIYRWRA